jgi:hypothetical protein
MGFAPGVEAAALNCGLRFANPPYATVSHTKAAMVMTVSGMRPLITFALLICVLVVAWSRHGQALSCAVLMLLPTNFDRDESDADPATQQRDIEARIALAHLEQTPIIFRGRFAWGRALSDVRKNQTPLYLFVFEDAEVLARRDAEVGVGSKGVPPILSVVRHEVRTGAAMVASRGNRHHGRISLQRRAGDGYR